MRLGLRDDARARDCAQAIEAAGACELVVHARLQIHGYRPPAYWDRIAALRGAVRLPLVANGEIWSSADAQRCRAESGCDRLMLGRGIVADPGLALAILAGPNPAQGEAAASPGLPWSAVCLLLKDFWWRTTHSLEPRYRAGRLKQWLQLLRLRHPEAAEAYAELRTVNDSRVITQRLFGAEPGAPAGTAQPAERARPSDLAA
ncbi:MAG TPA: tRNA-dihydrouridine synthase family protein, partial [Burkholderiaceae bacterium]|nr:tRNA-dihydrouridine synthase family protein [Burkholderiaceae bacterium]